ncbi:MAG: putative Dynein heavy chain 1, axonemal [Streblomastix strix]|uniref:Putative Dynein heavy chain 1, axonemal n=1 Tax=Streblomastix strix TaxID=222440 RepID=A0A5J4V4W7_9EUKA|nr:MAG: putative Dynein heavy chain 1, axonemal [Streblomastix strix]
MNSILTLQSQFHMAVSRILRTAQLASQIILTVQYRSLMFIPPLFDSLYDPEITRINQKRYQLKPRKGVQRRRLTVMNQRLQQGQDSCSEDMSLYSMQNDLALDVIASLVQECNCDYPPLFFVRVLLKDSIFAFNPPLQRFCRIIQKSISKSIHQIPKLPLFEIPALPAYTRRACLSITYDGDIVTKCITSIPQLFYDLTQGPLAFVGSLSRFQKFLQVRNNIEKNYSKELRISMKFLMKQKKLNPNWKNAMGMIRYEILHAVQSKCTKRYKEIIVEFGVYQKELESMPNTIESLFELNSNVKNLFEVATDREKENNSLEKKFQLLETFHFHATLDDSVSRWEALIAPARLIKVIKGLPTIIRALRTKIVAELAINQSELTRKIEDLTREANKYNNVDDYDSADKLAQDTAILSAQIAEAHALGVKYEKQEILHKLQIHTHPAIKQVMSTFEPVATMWITISDWSKYILTWTNTSFHDNDAYNFSVTTNNINQKLSQLSNGFVEEGNKRSLLLEMTNQIKSQVDAFQTRISMILKISNPSMKARHWQIIAQEIKRPIAYPTAEFTLRTMLEMKLEKYPKILATADNTTAEHAIETRLDRISQEMNQATFAVVLCKSSGTFILQSTRDIPVLIDEQRAAVQTFLTSPLISQFESRTTSWLSILGRFAATVSSWMRCQKLWLYFMPIFQGNEIEQRRPQETHKFMNVDGQWRKIMTMVSGNPHVLAVCGPQG